MLDRIYKWLNANVGHSGYALHAGGRYAAIDRVAIYTRSTEAAHGGVVRSCAGGRNAFAYLFIPVTAVRSATALTCPLVRQPSAPTGCRIDPRTPVTVMPRKLLLRRSSSRCRPRAAPYFSGRLNQNLCGSLRESDALAKFCEGLLSTNLTFVLKYWIIYIINLRKLFQRETEVYSINFSKDAYVPNSFRQKSSFSV